MTEAALLVRIAESLETIERAIKVLEKNTVAPQKIFSVEQAARYLNISTTSLERLRTVYAIDAVKNSDKRIGYTREALDKFIKIRTIRCPEDEMHLDRLVCKKGVKP